MEREKLTPEEAIQLLRRHRALPVLAHPGELKDPEKFLSPLRQAGLAGMEVFYGNYDAEKMGWLLSLAHRYQLLPCGGSDYHGLGNPGEPEPGSAGPPQEVVDRLLTLAGVPGKRSSLGPTLKR
ncbi:MAG: hypothetical protein HYY31_06115 [Chloroflexi bacterium]|nr:hypothetical protein [Chloroflexota bacterium]